MELIKKLRAATGAGILDSKQALDESGGDYDKAVEWLRKKGAASAAKKSDREASEGIIASYIHMNRIGVLLELNCETDFVARTDEFKQLANDIAMQVASMNPLVVSAEQIPAATVEKEREIYRAQMASENKPADVMEKIIEGKVQKWYKDACLLQQAFFRDDKKTIQDIIHEAVGKMGENIQVRRFVRFDLSDNAEVKDKVSL